MDRASSLIFPGSRTLASWWRQLAPSQPQALWIGYEFVHRIEAPVHVHSAQPIEPLSALVLQAIQLEVQLQPAALDAVNPALLEARLRLPIAVLQRVLIGMQETGLLARPARNGWHITDLGRHALHANQIPLKLCTRRVFPFVECLDAAGQRTAPPTFLPIADCAGTSWQVDESHRFEPGFLRAAIAQSSDWKQAHAFPGEIDALADDATVDAAQQVLLDRPQRVMLVRILTSNELLGFAVKVDSWTLHDREPVLRMPGATHSAPDVPPTVWQDAWRSWCRQRQLPTNEVDACTLTYRAPRLEVQAPPRLVQRLQSAKSDLFKGEAWLLVGDGYRRTAALLAMK
jgi:hypothetical protein